MNSKIIFSLGMLVLTLITFSGCKKHSEQFLGPEYVKAPDNFAVTVDVSNGAKLKAYNRVKLTGFLFSTPMFGKNQALPANPMRVNIKTNYQFYEAKFNATVRWRLVISSWKSHATKIITGYSNYIDESNSLWDGGSSNEYFFGVGSNDSAQVKLTIIGSNVEVVDTIKITGLKDYHLQTINGIKHFLVDDFEKSGVLPATNFSPFYPDASDFGGGNVGSDSYYPTKLQGDYSYYMYGKDVNSNTYIGSCNTPAVNDFPAGTFTTADPRDIYINMYIYGSGKPNVSMAVIAYENDNDWDPITHVPVYDYRYFDKLIYHIPVTWKGWKLVSFRYSQFVKPNDNGGFGNNQLTPEKLCGLALSLESYPTQGYEVDALVDMVSITEGGVFQKELVNDFK